MAYEPQQYTEAEAEAKARRLKMEQIRYQGDLRKIDRELKEAGAEGKKLHRELQQTEALITAHSQRLSTLEEKKRFLDDELRAIKRKLINLTGK